MPANCPSNSATGNERSRQGGFTLIEVMVSLLVALVIAGGMATLLVASTKSSTSNAANVQLLTSVRAKIEQVQSIPYMQVGINASGTAAGPGYFVIDPVYGAEYDAAAGDVLLSDTVTLQDGSVVTRTVTVGAVDDPTDGVGNADLDEVVDANTETILDYKLITVTAEMVRAGITYRQSMSTIIRGSLPQEIEGATGKDSDGTAPAKVGKVPKTVPPPAEPPPPECEVGEAPEGKEPGKKGATKQSHC